MKPKKGNQLRDKTASKPIVTSSRPSTSATANDEDDGIWKDPRFAHLVTDPRFKSMHKTTKKVKIDKRFAGMFSDAKFNVKYSTDKYGRRSTKTSSDDMKKYYAMSSDEDEKATEAIEREKEEKQMLAEAQMDKVESDEEIPDELKTKLKDLSVDYARGEGKLLTDSSSDESSSDDEQDNELFIDHVWGELDAEAPRTDESSRRLAACNMDWDRIRACDIMVLCSSFLPTGGSIVSVTIYPSEFGKERMAEEEIKGPQELTDRKRESDDIESDDSRDDQQDEEGNDFNMEKLRQYQLNRLKYYYAVIECDRVSTADKLYAECDGLEYESTATKLDLRFVPDDMPFDDKPKDLCTELPDMSKYMPRLFTTTALQQAKVELTWDENDVERKELSEKLMSGKLNEVADQELRKYVAYSSEEDSANDDGNAAVLAAVDNDEAEIDADKPKASIAKYKALLQEIQTREDKQKSQRIEMEYSWHIGGGTDKVDADETVAAVPTADDKTHFDKILEYKQQKKKDRKVEKKKKLKLLKSGKTDADSDTDESVDSDDDLPDGIDMNDPYFAEEFANGDFSAPKDGAKKSKQKKKVSKSKEATDSDADHKTAELELLLDDDDDNDGKAHFSLKKIQSTENESKTKKRRKKNLKRTKRQNEAEKALLDDDFRIDVNDSRFMPIYSSHMYSIDPTHASYKKTKGMEALIKEKLKRRPVDLEAADEETVMTKVPKKDFAVSMLVKSIKRKIQN